MTAVVPLYGGALRTQLPTTVGGRTVRFDDMSNLRQVPDHQEVYSDVDCGCAVIIELLGLEESVSSADLAAYHFSELAKANGCSRIQLTPPTQNPDGTIPTTNYDAVVVVPPIALKDEACPHFPDGPINVAPEALDAPTTTGAQSALQKAPAAGGGGPVVDGKFVIEGKQLIAKYKRPADGASASDEDEARNEVYIGLAVIRLAAPIDTEILVSVSAPLVLHPDSSEAKTMAAAGTAPLTAEQAQEVLRTVVAHLEVTRWSLFL